MYSQQCMQNYVWCATRSCVSVLYKFWEKCTFYNVNSTDKCTYRVHSIFTLEERSLSWLTREGHEKWISLLIDMRCLQWCCSETQSRQKGLLCWSTARFFFRPKGESCIYVSMAFELALTKRSRKQSSLLMENLNCIKMKDVEITRLYYRYRERWCEPNPQ